MAADRYSAVWVSHTSIADFLKCPRSYFLRNMYKDPKSRRKIQITSPSLSLGMGVHDVLESLSILPTERRFSGDLLEDFEKGWKKYTGKKGGFTDPEVERQYKERGLAMIRRVLNHPGPLKNKAVKLTQDLPQYYISEADNIILCGKVDWLEYIPESDSVHIIDFKTSKSEEDGNSLQLPIYTLLVANTQKRKTSKASYWYLEFSDDLQEKVLPDISESHDAVLKISKQISLARKLSKLDCPYGGCKYCEPLERVLKGDAEFVGVDEKMGKDNYILHKHLEEDSVIL
ncbi:MAG: PD-(D/E)XK nuclease family protein [Candidatus Woesebacteria bacterium]